MSEPTQIILASASKVRAKLLQDAGISILIDPAHIDEDEVKQSMLKERASPAQIAETLAELKALSRSSRHAGFVIGADQTLSLDKRLFDKAKSREEAKAKLKLLRGKKHKLHCAACIAKNSAIIWRHVNSIELQMRDFSDEFLEDYLDKNPESLLRSVGAYELEHQGSQLFTSLSGDYFSILGLPLLEIQAFLRTHNILKT